MNFKIQNELKREMQQEKEIQHKRRVKALLARVGLLAMLLVVSTYAWFTSQKDVTLSNIRGTVEVVENMEISLDGKTWYQRIDLSDAEAKFTEAQTSRNIALGENDADDKEKSTALAILPEQLFPVSGVGKTGENVKLLPLYTGEATSTSLSGITQCLEETSDASGADVAVDNGYFAFDIYIKNTSRDSEEDVLQLNINSSAQVITETINKQITDVYGNRVDRTYNGNDASGLQNTIRVALAKYEGEVSSTATQVQILDSTKTADIEDIAIWEPNAYDHVETIVSNNNRLINGSNTNKIPFVSYKDGPTTLETYALNEQSLPTGTAQGKIENVYNVSSAGLGVQSTFKTDNIKSANYATDGIIESYRIKTTDAKPLDIKNIAGQDFKISANTVTRYRVYVWIEGQDVDCINVASLGGGIELDLGLTKDDEVGDVLSEIDNRVSYTVEEGKVTATITMNNAIVDVPSGWEYVTGTDNKQIKKEYTSNDIEQIEVKDENGKITKIEVNVTQLGNGGGAGGSGGGTSLASQITTNKAENYGLYTNYPVDIDGNATDNDWQIFYTDGTNVFLKVDDYVPSEKIGTDKLTAAGLSTYETYGIYWNSPSSLSYTISDSKYMISKANEFTSSNKNYKAVGSLLATSNWTNFANSTYATDAIGSPTIEMWCESWNTVYDATNYPNQQIYCNNVNSTGYYVGSTINPEAYWIDMSSYVGYTNTNDKSKMYFPHTESVDDDNCWGYWLASPSASHADYLLSVLYDGGVSLNSYGRSDLAGAPVVSLKSNIPATKVGSVWELGTN